MSDNRIRNIAIVGGGITGWIAASALARVLRDPGAIGLIDIASAPAGISLTAPAESAMPRLKALHEILGIDEYDFMRRTDATFRLGTEFKDWSRIGQSYFHPHGEIGAALENVAFRHHWLKQRRGGELTDLSDFSLAAVAARAGKFTRPSSDPRSVLSTFDHGYNLDGPLYAKYLRAYAEKTGVKRIEGEIAEVALRPEDGFVEALVLQSGERVEADLFIDCSGPGGVLIEEALKTGFEDWGHWLPCDRAVSVSTAPVADPLPAMCATAREAGWQWRIPLQHRTGNGYVYSSRHLSDDAALASLLAELDGGAAGDPTLSGFSPGRRRQFWNRNVVALGAAACVMDPLESTDILLVQEGISRLLTLFPDRSFAAGETTEYNRLMGNLFERVRDFLILHYKATTRSNSDFWNACRTMPLTESLDYKIKLFASRGRVVLHDEETFLEPDWTSVFIGQEVFPERLDPLADAADSEHISNQMRRIRSAIRQGADSMPRHRSYIEKFCAAKAVS